jgi:hypothetical protein
MYDKANRIRSSPQSLLERKEREEYSLEVTEYQKKISKYQDLITEYEQILGSDVADFQMALFHLIDPPEEDTHLVLTLIALRYLR